MDARSIRKPGLFPYFPFLQQNSLCLLLEKQLGEKHRLCKLLKIQDENKYFFCLLLLTSTKASTTSGKTCLSKCFFLGKMCKTDGYNPGKMCYHANG